MKVKFSVLISLVYFFALSVAQGQSVGELESRFKKATSKQDKMNIAYELADKMKRSNAAKAADYAWQANQLAIQVGDKRREAESANLSAEATLSSGNLKLAAERYTQSWNAARNYGLRDLAINSADRLQEISRRQNNLKEELKWSREVVNYLKESGGGSRGGGDAQRRLENQLAAAEQKIRELVAKLEQATGQSQSLETSYQTQLKEIQDKSQQQITQKETTISQIEQARQQSDSLVRTKSRMVDVLTKDQMADSIVRAQQERDIQTQQRMLAEAETQKTRSDALRNLLGVVAAFVLVLAGLFYFRYRAKRRTVR
jgi:hypothetical protein